MPKKPPSLPPIPTSFTAKKNHILASLAQPTDTYTDLSPKGSVDVPIRNLIDRLNAIEGFVTTSSCSGRVSVFAEGEKSNAPKPSPTQNSKEENEEVVANASEREDDKEEAASNGVKKDENGSGTKQQKSTPGGKGRGGRWLFVSHDPLLQDFDIRSLGLHNDAKTSTKSTPIDPTLKRYIRFAFEPMILHIMTASLSHASLILAAAINAGFRESGVQSLKNLTDAEAYPMVAVRSAGLAFESLVGVIEGPTGAETREDGPERVRRLVDDGYLDILVGIAGERFRANSERIARFEGELFGKEGEGRGRLG